MKIVNKFIILIVLAGINSFISGGWSDCELSSAEIRQHDVVICEFTPKEDLTNVSGSNSLSFLALQHLDSNKDEIKEKHVASSNYYKVLAILSHHKMEKKFYACMSDLDQPETAVKDGTYKKCIRQTWNSRPWLNNIVIGVNEKTKSENSESAWKIISQRFKWYDPVKSLSFLLS